MNVSDVEEIVNRRIAEINQQREYTGHVTSLDPPTVQLGGGTMHPAAMLSGLTLGIGDRVVVLPVGRGYIVLGQADAVGASGSGGVGHAHDDLYALLGHPHVEADITNLGNYTEIGHPHVEADITNLGSYASAAHSHNRDVEFLERKNGTGALTITFSLGSYGSTYDHYRVVGGHAREGESGVSSCELRCNSDNGTNYSIMRVAMDGTGATAFDTNMASDGLFFNATAARGFLLAEFLNRDGSIINIELRYRCRSTGTLGNNRWGHHLSAYNGGPLTSIQFTIGDTGWDASTELDLYGIRGG